MSRDINVDMAVKYQREIDTLKDEKRSLIQVVAAKGAEIEKLHNALVESMIAPEALLIAGKPGCIAQEIWGQIVRSIEIARSALGKA